MTKKTFRGLLQAGLIADAMLVNFEARKMEAEKVQARIFRMKIDEIIRENKNKIFEIRQNRVLK